MPQSAPHSWLSSTLPIGLPIPGIITDNAGLYIFLGWFLLSVASALPPRAPKVATQ